jgi:hypothetical protein
MPNAKTTSELAQARQLTVAVVITAVESRAACLY